MFERSKSFGTPPGRPSTRYRVVSELDTPVDRVRRKSSSVSVRHCLRALVDTLAERSGAGPGMVLYHLFGASTNPRDAVGIYPIANLVMQPADLDLERPCMVSVPWPERDDLDERFAPKHRSQAAQSVYWPEFDLELLNLARRARRDYTPQTTRRPHPDGLSTSAALLHAASSWYDFKRGAPIAASDAFAVNYLWQLRQHGHTPDSHPWPGPWQAFQKKLFQDHGYAATFRDPWTLTPA